MVALSRSASRTDTNIKKHMQSRNQTKPHPFKINRGMQLLTMPKQLQFQGPLTFEAMIFIAMTCHSLCCTRVGQYLCSCSWATSGPAGAEGWSRYSPDVPANLSQSVIPLSISNMYRNTLFLFRPRTSYAAQEAGQLIFWCFSSASFQVPVNDIFSCFYPTKCAYSSMYLRVLVA